jgi:hypothetical protein
LCWLLEVRMWAAYRKMEWMQSCDGPLAERKLTNI